ncbi:hypothetical protein AB0D66_31715 [Streptomyces sp. NPDC048270]|uniref:hypothetical protein n=1 Tax=Streptomyces sp. NPDC048270 TaxID=3154615 RepID=UPI00340B28EC
MSRTRRLVLLTASTALAAGAVSMSSSAIAAPATTRPVSMTTQDGGHGGEGILTGNPFGAKKMWDSSQGQLVHWDKRY